MELENHRNKCRFCLGSIQKPWNSVEIDKKIADIFFGLTKTKLATTAKYSSKVCKPCLSDMKLSFECQQKLISSQRMLYQLENDSLADVKESSEPEVKTEFFEFESDNKQMTNEDLSSSDSKDDEPPCKRRKSQNAELSLPQMILDLRQQNERIMRQLAPIQSTLQKTCQNTSLLLIQQLKQNDTDSTATSYIPPPPIANVDDFDSFEAFLMQNAHAPTKESTKSVNELVNYYAGKIMNADSRTSLVMGLIKSFFELYFETNFLHTLGWSNYEHRIAFQTYRAHIELITMIINRHSPLTFTNTSDAFKPVSIFFKRMHELRSRHKKLAQSSDMVGKKMNETEFN